MPWVNCTNLRFHCTKLPDIDLCPRAFSEGRFPPGTCAKDFIRIDPSSATTSASGWSDQETLLLLEALELHGDHWVKIAEHVGSKSRLDCVLHFLQLPIEEEFVADLEACSSKVRDC
jgi:SWI/SNF related-matrix-associated actin-dependent regulator of chromatin subfamily C